MNKNTSNDERSNMEQSAGPDILAVHPTHRSQGSNLGSSKFEVAVMQQGDSDAPREVTGEYGTPKPHDRSDYNEYSERPARRGGRSGKPPKDNNSSSGGGGRGKAILKAFAICLCLVGVAVLLALFVVESANDLLGLDQVDEEIEVNISEGTSSSDIIGILSDLGIVDQPLTFQFYAGLGGDLDSFLPGQYLMNSNMSYDEILILLRTGNPEGEAPVETITFYEGMSAWEIADRLEEHDICDADVFIQTLETADFSDYEFVNLVPDHELQYLRFEGFLFPDTYDFFVGEDPERTIRRFFDNFQVKTADYIDEMNNMNLSLYEAITLASVIQAEAGLPEEMAKVSSVFHNRLDNPEIYPKLQSDVTRDYVRYEITPNTDIVNQEMNDAYNTYVGDGLPVGPINNPGMDAILATINPDDTPYFFFVTDANAKYYYSVTFEEHVVNVYAAAAVGETHGTATE